MYQQTTSVKVNEFLEEVSKRNTEIDNKVCELDLQIKSLNQEILEAQESIVEYDLNKDVNSKNTLVKEKNKFNAKLNDLISERAAYVEAKKPGNNSLKVKAEKISEVAEKEINQIHILIAKKNESISKLQTQKVDIEKNIASQELELQNLEWNINNIEGYQVSKITKYLYGQDKNISLHEDRTPKAITGNIIFSNGDESKPYEEQF